MSASASPVCGIVLAAGAGTRYGMPKALARTAEGVPWLHAVCAALRDGGCDSVFVVLGARADEAAALVPEGARVVEARDWADGLSASLRAGLDAAAGSGAEAAVIAPVDMPGLPASVVTRLLTSVTLAPDVLARATYDGQPGHPALIGRTHWARIAATVSGDRGAAAYLRTHPPVAVPCSDLFSGADRDTPA